MAVDLHEQWLAESLTKARESVRAIDPAAVPVRIRAGVPTDNVFETPINDAKQSLVRQLSGVFPALDQISKEGQRYNLEGLEELARIKKLAGQIQKEINNFRKNWPSGFLDDPRQEPTDRTQARAWTAWFVALLLVILLIPTLYYYNVYKQSSAPSLIAARPEVQEKLHSDAATIRQQASAPNKDLLERSVGVVKNVWEMIDKVPKIFGAVVIVWGFVMKMFQRTPNAKSIAKTD